MPKSPSRRTFGEIQKFELPEMKSDQRFYDKLLQIKLL